MKITTIALGSFVTLVHEDAIAAVERYFGRLKNLDLSGCLENIDHIFSLGKQLTSAYERKTDGHLATETLVTKIMMGTRLAARRLMTSISVKDYGSVLYLSLFQRGPM